MFNTLSEKLTQTVQKLSGQNKLTESNIEESTREVRRALLEADVALEVINTLLKNIKKQAIDQKVINSLTPGQTFVKIIKDELTVILGEKNTDLALENQPPSIIVMAGLQGSGKTTTIGKLAKFLKQKNKKVMTVSCDVYRDAAINQLETVSKAAGAEFIPSKRDDNPLNIAKSAKKLATKKLTDVLIIDTAGRLHIDEAMMREIKSIVDAVSPHETLFVLDSMMGQDAAITAKEFNQTLDLTGIILSKTDGDSRGGAALSVRMLTGKPIKFLGVGEKIDALEAFHPERLASRILGMGDMLTLIEDAQDKITKKEANKLAKKVKKGRFDLVDFRSQLDQMSNMGGIKSLMAKLPNMPDLPKDSVNEKEILQLKAIIDSMTFKERQYPDLIKGSRKRRIAKGSGTEIQDVNRLLKQFNQMQKMMKKLSKKGGMSKMMGQIQNMMGPKGFPPF